MTAVRNKTFERVRSALLAVAGVCTVVFGILYVLSLLLPEIGLTASDAELTNEAAWLKGLFIMEPYIFTVAIVAIMVVFIMDRSVSIYNYRQSSAGISYSGYDEWMGLCWKVIYLTSLAFFLVIVVYVVAVFALAGSSAEVRGAYVVKASLPLGVLFLCAATLMIIAGLAYVALLALRHKRVKDIVNRNSKAFERYPFFRSLTTEQYKVVIDLLCECGLEPKTKKAAYAGANRDGVSNCLMALSSRGFMDAVSRENVGSVIAWLEGIDGLDAHFSDNPDDFLEKFSLPSELRQRRISAIESRLEREGV